MRLSLEADEFPIILESHMDSPLFLEMCLFGVYLSWRQVSEAIVSSVCWVLDWAVGAILLSDMC